MPSRVETLLKASSDDGVTIPKPQSRLESILYKHLGYDIDVPDPQSRIEILLEAVLEDSSDSSSETTSNEQKLYDFYGLSKEEFPFVLVSAKQTQAGSTKYNMSIGFYTSYVESAPAILCYRPMKSQITGGPVEFGTTELNVELILDMIMSKIPSMGITYTGDDYSYHTWGENDYCVTNIPLTSTDYKCTMLSINDAEKSEVDIIEDLIDNSGVLEDTEGSVSEKVEQLIDLAEESANKWQNDTSEVIFENNCYQNVEVSCLITENGTLTYKRNKLSLKNQKPKWQFNNASQMFSSSGSVGASAWLKVEQAEVINVPEATEEYLITELDQCCFCLLYSLKRVRLPDTITKIGDKVFSYCISLKEVNLPDAISSFGAGCFSFCYSLEEFDIPPLVTSLPNNMFQHAYKLTKVNGTERLTSVGNYCFDSCHTLREIAFGENLNTVGSNAFSGCITLKKVQFKSNSITFGGNAFNYCGSLENISFVAESIQNSVSFPSSRLLSAESIQSIIDGLATVETAQTLTLHSAITLTDEQKATINAKGWTLAQ